MSRSTSNSVATKTAGKGASVNGVMKSAIAELGSIPPRFQLKCEFWPNADRRSGVDIHWFPIPQRQPAAHDAVNDPYTGGDENHYRKRNADERHKQKATNQAP